jgi:hypothetical protein
VNRWLNLRTEEGVRFRMLDLVEFTFIIEHQNRGLFRGFGHAQTSGKYGPRWLVADHITRRSPEVWSTRSPDEAMTMISRVLEHHKDAYLVRMQRKP